MDAVDRFLNLVASSRGLPAPQVDVSRAVLSTIRARQQVALYFDFAPLAITATLAIAAGVFLVLSLHTTLPVDRSVAEVMNPISLLIP